MSVSVFIPVRKGSERVKRKNTRIFAGIKGGLLYIKLKQLESIKGVDEIIVSTNDEECLSIAQNFTSSIPILKVIERPTELGSSKTLLTDLISYVPTLTSSDYILWTHVTSPFCNTLHYENAITIFENKLREGYDSLITGRNYSDFLLNPASNKIINNRTDLEWPRTQDLMELFEINNAIFVAHRKAYLKSNRVGIKPYLMTMDKITSLDIDDMSDFKMAEILYGKL
ncbi:hypothetical protein L1I30_13435 [Gillisia sp. M10.2A]|uniref:Acylneuraminate cytidylyltransferase n=1 Tax=Gillisia lutea TaxID=2909668 RepID=A0ABS9ELC3_9FLAO|nr:hypothetical protein [Gillisia lutea]MCF4102674.1 hypothetical protein [Gillisia lutea]